MGLAARRLSSHSRFWQAFGSSIRLPPLKRAGLLMVMVGPSGLNGYGLKLDNVKTDGWHPSG
jgi:hypothetical protein